MMKKAQAKKAQAKKAQAKKARAKKARAASQTMSQPDFRMRFEPVTIDHLGLRLYSTLPPVISELVSNGFDAESPRVEVIVPLGSVTPDSEVVVKDFGHGMDRYELANEYLPIGRCRRGPDESNQLSKNGIRKVTGRKGLGKLSAFGIATEMDIRAVKSGQAICLRMNYDKIKQWMRDNPGADFHPELVAERSGNTTDPDGVEIRLRKLHRSRAINADEVRKGLARRLSVIGASFDVQVNGVSVGPGDRLSRDQCAEGFCWEVDQIEIPGGLSTGPVTGWVGFMSESSQTDRGVDIFANGKAVELGSFFRLASTHAQFARAHLIGEVHADFLDQDKDLVATARNSVVWESEDGLELETWGQKLLKWAFDQWLSLRRREKEVEVTRVNSFDRWL